MNPLARVVIDGTGVAGRLSTGFGFATIVHGFKDLLRLEANIRMSTIGSSIRDFVENGSSEKYGDSSKRDMN